MDQRKLEAMLNAIVGIVVKVESLEGQWKLGQHKGRGDHDGAVAGLRALGDPRSLAVAELMAAARGAEP
jgi:transcriptional regulator